MRSNNEHRWRESDDLVAFYLFRHGTDQLGVALSQVADVLGIELGAMNMRKSNFRSQESPGGLANAAKQTRAIFEIYRNTPEIELRAMVLGVLMRAREVG
jgi:hypothetical protein